MYIQETIKKSIIENRKEVEISQHAMISAVSSLIYSEYLKRIVQKEVPVRRILVPTIRSVREVLEPNRSFMTMMSEKFIDAICSHELFRQYLDAPEFKMFNQDNIEVFKVIFDLYIAKNIHRTIPEVICRKFCLLDDNQQVFVENREADLFDRNPITDDQFRFIVDETVLNLIVMNPSITKVSRLPENNDMILLTDKEVMSINHTNAICPIYFNASVVKNESVIHLLEFVTSTQITSLDNASYNVSTSLSNEVSIMEFGDIKK